MLLNLIEEIIILEYIIISILKPNFFLDKVKWWDNLLHGGFQISSNKILLIRALSRSTSLSLSLSSFISLSIALFLSLSLSHSARAPVFVWNNFYVLIIERRFLALGLKIIYNCKPWVLAKEREKQNEKRRKKEVTKWVRWQMKERENIKLLVNFTFIEKPRNYRKIKL